MLRRLFWLFVLIGACPCVARGQGGRIEQIRQDANQSDSSSSSGSSKSKFNGLKAPDDDDDGLFSELYGAVLWYGVALPFWLPHTLMDDDLAHYGYFPRYPYPDDYPAYLWEGRWPSAPQFKPAERELEDTRWWSVRITAEDGNDFRGMNRAGIRATIDTAARFGVQSNWNYLTENLGGGRHDNTLLGDTSLTYRFAQHEQIQMYAGLGFRVLTDPCTTNWGVNCLYGFDYFPVKPVVISGLIDGGNLGSAGVVHTRATVGVTKEHFELFGGYDFMRIGSVNIQGPLVGLRFWF